MSHGPAVTRELVATRPRASIDRGNISDHFWWEQKRDGNSCDRFELDNEKLKEAPKQNSRVVGF